MIVGITGGIGSGKSAVADAFASHGVPIAAASLPAPARGSSRSTSTACACPEPGRRSDTTPLSRVSLPGSSASLSPRSATMKSPGECGCGRVSTTERRSHSSGSGNGASATTGIRPSAAYG